MSVPLQGCPAADPGTAEGGEDFPALLEAIRGCRVCAPHLPLGPRPIVQLHPAARILLVSQAPGRRVHATGVPFDDPSGDRLRDWLGLDRATFHDPRRVAILPMGFCHPGRGRGGDLPPRPECAPLWHPRVLPHLRRVRLAVAIGRYAVAHYLARCGRNLTEVVRNWRSLPPPWLAVPHPSPRNGPWPLAHPWFGTEVLPELRRRVRLALEEERG